MWLKFCLRWWQKLSPGCHIGDIAVWLSICRLLQYRVSAPKATADIHNFLFLMKPALFNFFRYIQVRLPSCHPYQMNRRLIDLGFLTDVSGQPIGPKWDRWTYKAMLTHSRDPRLSWNLQFYNHIYKNHSPQPPKILFLNLITPVNALLPNLTSILTLYFYMLCT